MMWMIGVVEVGVQPQLGRGEGMLEVVGMLMEVGRTLLLLLGLVLDYVQGFAPAENHKCKKWNSGSTMVSNPDIVKKYKKTQHV